MYLLKLEIGDMCSLLFLVSFIKYYTCLQPTHTNTYYVRIKYV